ncbi:hypothetical protein [Methylobacterium aerolatum]|uniref:Uncharacterized protein n=1 Tax=Methylobacterium aerolatum TaxID=418708 RepID=A0ABU0I5J4_9HYPH|nr:hypothetical protein [Methylobacterium aerolatum]MDQ0449881.1 hypothetical protein [Methylobacterium aerolatum]GJD37202.1 hypothetical protein FMGBMHLM_4129 [Methylobacterium aerolatum]
MSSFSRISPVMVFAVPLTLFAPADVEGQKNGSVHAHQQYTPVSPAPSVRRDDRKMTAEPAQMPVKRSVSMDLRGIAGGREQIASIQLICATGGIAVRSGDDNIVFDNDHRVFDVSRWNLQNVVVEQNEVNGNIVHLSIIASISSNGDPGETVLSRNVSIDFATGVIGTEEPKGFLVAQTSETAERASPVDDTEGRTGLGTPNGDLSSNVYLDVAPSIAKTDEDAVGKRSAAPAEAARQDNVARRVDPISDRGQVKPDSGRDGDSSVLIAKARSFIERGDISSARLLLERARGRGSAEGILLLGQTFDPDKLRAWNVRGLRPDQEKAQSLYAEADRIGGLDGRRAAAIP